MTSPAPWTDIKSIQFKFRQHSDTSSNYPGVHKLLNATYSDGIFDADLNDLFEDSTRSIFKKDAISILRTQIIANMTINARLTTDKGLIKQFVDEMIITSPLNSTMSQWRSYKAIERTFQHARNNKQENVHIFLSIDLLHFHPGSKDRQSFNPMRFEDISNTPFPTPTTVPQSPGTGPTPPGPNTGAFTTNDMTTLGTAIGLALGNAAKTNPANPANPSSSGYISALNSFGTSKLPPDVCDRYLKNKDSNHLMPGSAMTRFLTKIPNLSKDPNGTIMRTAEYHLDPGGIGHRLITRDGTCFALTEHSTPASEKAFLSTMPPCKGTTARDIRSWYHRFTAHAAQHRVYVHPYYCFRPHSGSSSGFSIGIDTDTVTYDLPDKHHINIPMWNSQIYTAISKDSIFPKDSPAKDTVLDHYGEGYAALYNIISSSHPEVVARPALLVTSPPTQQMTHSIGKYHGIYCDYLKQKAYIDDIARNLNHAGELDRFIAGTLYGEELNRLCREERLSSDPKVLQRYTQGQIAVTLNSLLNMIPQAKLDAIRRTNDLHKFANDSDDTSTARTADTSAASSLTNPTTYSRVSTNTSKAGTTYSPASSRYPRKPGSPYKPRKIFTKPVNVHAIDVDMNDPLESLILPDTLSEYDTEVCDRYCAFINGLQTSPNAFDINNPCKVCKTSGHTFKDCKLLQNNELLRAHFIGIRLKDDHLQKLIDRHSKEVHSVDASANDDKEFNNLDFRLDEI